MSARILTAVLVTLLACQHAEALNHDKIKQHSTDIFESLVDIRRDLHKHPEVSGEEQRTSKVVAEYLSNLGLEVKTNIGGYGVVGILNGHKKGRKIAWRADIDAIASDAPDSVDFASLNEGVRHICGHDIHTVVGLGIASTLAQQADDVEGSVYFLFQPAEENFQGARAMIDDGLFDLIQPDEIYGAHVTPMPAGVIATKPDEVYSYRRRVKLAFKDSIDIEALTQSVNTVIQSMVRTKLNAQPWNLQHLVDPAIGLENPDTIYQEYLIPDNKLTVKESDNQLEFEAGVVESNPTNLDNTLTEIREKLGKTKYADRLISVEYIQEGPSVVNDTELANMAIDTIRSVYGEKSVARNYGVVPYFNDDFAYFQQTVPGVYFFLGGSNFEQGVIAMPHTPEFNVDEHSIEIGVSYFSSLILERINDD